MTAEGLSNALPAASLELISQWWDAAGSVLPGVPPFGVLSTVPAVWPWAVTGGGKARLGHSSRVIT